MGARWAEEEGFWLARAMGCEGGEERGGHEITRPRLDGRRKNPDGCSFVFF
jgi:hypothetical protein